MGNSNKVAKEELMKIYGANCMFEKARIAERIEKMGGIRTYKSFTAEKRFKGKRIKKQLTYHHLIHKSEGGKATIENGAVVDATAHAYLHSLPRHQEEIVNNMLRAYKINVLAFNTEKIIEYRTIEFDDSDYLSIPLEDDDLLYNRKRAISERKKREQLSRAKIKTETRKALEKYYEEER